MTDARWSIRATATAGVDEALHQALLSSGLLEPYTPLGGHPDRRIVVIPQGGRTYSIVPLVMQDQLGTVHQGDLDDPRDAEAAVRALQDFVQAYDLGGHEWTATWLASQQDEAVCGTCGTVMHVTDGGVYSCRGCST